jgi:hypothetical protein
LHQLNIVLCLVLIVWLINIEVNLIQLIFNYLKKYYGVIIILIIKLKNLQKNHKLVIENVCLFNLFYNLFIKYLHILLVKIKLIYKIF